MQLKQVRNITVILLVMSVLSAGCQNKKSRDMDFSTIKEFDLERYLGTWYEIARYDHRFERGLVGVTATYSKRDDGKIKVVNQGFKKTLDGKHDVAVGKAKTTDVPGKLKVSFFWFFYADYLIMELDDNYQWALIGSNSDKYLWILSRTPQLDEATKNHILENARERGYDTSKLIWVKQKTE